MEVDVAAQAGLPDLTLADRLFLLSLPETTNKDQLLTEIKQAIQKDSTLVETDAFGVASATFKCS